MRIQKIQATLPESVIINSTSDSLVNAYSCNYVNGLISNIAPTYDNTQTYNEGDSVIYDGVLYVCNTAISSAEDFDNTKWDSTTLVEILGNIKNALEEI